MNRQLRVPAVTLTTRHSAAVYLWTQPPALPSDGALIGVDILAGGRPFRYDPWSAYAANVVTSPNMVVAGQLGRGKSSLVKTYLHRQLTRRRQAFVLDPKGEYGPLARQAGLTVVRLHPGGSHTLNPLDPPPGRPTAEETSVGRANVVCALAGVGLGRELFSEEKAAVAAISRRLGDTPMLADVVHALLRPDDNLAAALSTTATALAAAVRPVAMELHRLLAGDLAGMVDGPSTIRLDPTAPGVVVDLSQLRDRDALAAVMVCAGSWLSSTLAAPSDTRRLLLVDEAWALLAEAATTTWLQQTSKLARAHGVQLITVVHRLSDLAAQADAGTATKARAEGLLADADTHVIYGQSPGERNLATRLLGLTPPEADLVCGLAPYRGLWRVGNRTAVVDHVVASDEWNVIDTDQAMRP